jgi:hypothetical protein
MMGTVNGLRLYIRAENTKSLGNNVFYSQRSNGPIYRWRFEEELGHWRVARMHTSDLNSQDLCAANWKSVPQKLQAQLGEHYLE